MEKSNEGLREWEEKMTSTMLRSTSRGVLAAAAAAVAVVLFFLAPATGATPRDRLASAIYMADLDHVRRLMDQWHEGIEMIAQSPIDIGRRDELGRIALMMCGTDPQEDHVATDKACGEIGRLLIKAGADVDAIDEKEWSVVAYAASLGWSTLVQRLVKAGANISRPDNTGVTPLIKATIQGRDAVVKVLLDAGASSSQSGPPPGSWPALFYAIHNAHVKVDAAWLRTAKALLDHGCDVNGLDSLGRTALVIASSVNASNAPASRVRCGPD